MKEYRIIKAYSLYSVGQIITPPGMLRSQLMKLGFIEPVESEQLEVESAMMPEPHTAMMPKPKRGRGRPRKVRA